MKLFRATNLLLLICLPYAGLGAPVRGITGSIIKDDSDRQKHLKAAAAVTAAHKAALKTQTSLFPDSFPPGVKFAAPGPNWLTDPDETILFLPIGVSKELPIEDLKIMSDGTSILVLSTIQPKIEEGRAEREFKLLLEALKSKAKGDETKLESELSDWYQSEQDAEVKSLVGETLFGLREVMRDKANKSKRATTVPFRALVQRSAKVLSSSSLHNFLQVNVTTDSSRRSKQGGSTSSLLGQRKLNDTKLGAARIIKESFQVDMPVPHNPLGIFALQRSPEEYFICYTFNPDNWGLGDEVAQEQLPFKKIKIYDMSGKFLA